MRAFTYLAIVFFIGSMIVSLFTPYPAWVRAGMVWMSLMSLLILLLSMHFRRVREQVPHMPGSGEGDGYQYGGAGDPENMGGRHGPHTHDDGPSSFYNLN